MSDKNRVDDVIDDQLDEDPGDVTFDRFMYQATATAAQALALVDPESEVREIYSEHLDDILLVFRDGRRRAIQVKTRDRHLPPFRCSHKPVYKAVRRFCELDAKNDTKFDRFFILTNHGFHEEEGNDKSLPYLLSVVDGSAGDAPFEYLADRCGVSVEVLRSVLSRTQTIQGPQIEFDLAWLESQVRMSTFAGRDTRQIPNIARDLRAMATLAMEYNDNSVDLRSQIESTEGFEQAQRRTVLQNKRIVDTNVRAVVENAGKADWESPPALIFKSQGYVPLPSLLSRYGEELTETTVFEVICDTRFAKPWRERDSVEMALVHLDSRIGEYEAVVESRPESQIHFHGIAPIPLTFLTGAAMTAGVRPVLYEKGYNGEWLRLEPSDEVREVDLSIPDAEDIQPHVVILISVSAEVDEQFAKNLNPNATVIKIEVPEPQLHLVTDSGWPDAVSSRLVDAFKWITSRGREVEKVHILAAAPMSVVFECGRRFNPKMFPPTYVYHYDRQLEVKNPWGLLIDPDAADVLVWRAEE